MTREKKKVRSGHFGLRTKTHGRGLLSLYDSIVTKEIPTVNNFDQLGKPYSVLTCWLCGTSRNVNKYHAAGGILGVCDRCNGGEL